ncbi:hypothetical protein E2K93_12450 [Thalassotalea sp. HSM 43]|uniref:hypothetical protein n=1 Tax=Thalassotalea sp. HSM 43 TaxID=2552945 RepID=UPI00108075A4|nr:hypothetical protein [Thalassotalea sp. HSM 43]QBY05143.1 hypothetical protein E2K93_12450 [Thalassotalea sp. HSM 43]
MNLSNAPKPQQSKRGNQARHKTYDIRSSMLGSVELPDGLSAVNWLGLMELIQHVGTGQRHNEDKSYAAINGTTMRQIFGNAKNGGLVLSDDVIRQTFSIFEPSKTHGWCAGIKYKPDSQLEAVMSDLNGQYHPKLEQRVRLTAEQIYEVQVNGGHTVALIGLKEVNQYLSSRLGADAPSKKQLRDWNQKCHFGTSIPSNNIPTIPAVSGASGEPSAEKCHFGTSIPSNNIPTIPAVSGSELLPPLPKRKLAAKGHTVSIIKLNPLFQISGEPMFTSNANFKPDRSTYSPAVNKLAKYNDETVTCTIDFDIEHLKRYRDIFIETITSNGETNNILLEQYDYYCRILAENNGSYTWTYWRHQFGRLNLLGNDFNLHTIKRELRKALLSGHYSYDLSTAHPRFLVAIAKSMGMRLPHWEQLIQNKHGVRRHIANTAKITMNEAKSLVTSIIYGKGLNKGPAAKAVSFDSEHEYIETMPIYSIRPIDEIMESLDAKTTSFLQGLKTEIDIFTPMLEIWWSNHNFHSLEYPESISDDDQLPEFRRAERLRSRRAFILTQLEADVITIIREMGIELAAIIHDGFTVTAKPISDNVLYEIESKFDARYGLEYATVIHKE